MFEDFILFPAYRVTSMAEDELFYLQRMEEAIGRIRGARAGKPWDQTAALSSSNQLRRISLRFWFSRMALPNYTRATETALRNEAFRQLSLAAIAIKRYHLRRGAFPPALAALTPAYLNHPTRDPWNGGLLRYRPDADGGFVLYSVGQDTQDDGGDARPATGGRIGLWEGRDFVWPQAH